MKRALLSVVAIVGYGAANAAPVVIYDSITGTAGMVSTTSTPRNLMADGFSTISTPYSGMSWKITKVDLVLFVSGAVTNSPVTGILSIYNTWSPSGTSGSGSNVFADLAGTATQDFGTVTTTGSKTFKKTFDLSANPIFLTNTESMGFTVNWLSSGAVIPAYSTVALNQDASIRGSLPSSNVWYRDVNGNGIIESGEGRVFTDWTNNNLGIRITAEAVPEPMSIGALALGFSGLLLRRRKR
jgi:hypothetical protein